MSIGTRSPLRCSPRTSKAPGLDRWFHDEPSVRRFVKSLGNPKTVRLCYEAGPTGYGLARLLERLGVSTEVIAPSLIPITPGAKIKTDKRDARRLAQLYRAGELTAVHIPSDAEEAIRDLARTRADLVTDRTRCRHRLSKFLLRHGEVFREGRAWTMAHERWLINRHFDDPALAQTYAHYRAIVADLDAHLERRRIRSQVLPRAWALRRSRGTPRPPTGASPSSAPSPSRPRSVIGGASPGRPPSWAFADLFLLSTRAGRARVGGGITKAGNTHLRAQLVESAWSYQHRPRVGPVIEKRQQRCSPDTVARAWHAQLHLCTKFRRLAERKSSRKIVVTAIARELSGFLWAEMAA